MKTLYSFILLFFYFSIVNVNAQTQNSEILVHPEVLKHSMTHWGYDIKQPGKAVGLTNANILKVFVEDKMNMVRIPFYPRAGHPSLGVVTESAYTPILEALNRIKTYSTPIDFKIFASLRLEGPLTFPLWVKNADTVTVNASKYAQLVSDFLVFMKSKNINVDILGVDNEAEYNDGVISQSKYKTILDTLRKHALNGKFTLPSKFIGPENYGPDFAWLNALKANGNFSQIDISGTHYYPHLRPLANLTTHFASSFDKPIWNSEIHWDAKSDVPDHKEAAEALVAMFDNLDLRFSGFVYWDYNLNRTSYRGRMMSEFVRATTPGAKVIDVDDEDGRTMTNQSKLNTRATRVDNTVYLWVLNNKTGALTNKDIKVADGSTITGTPTLLQWNKSTLTNNGTSIPITDNGLKVTFPDSSISLIKFDVSPTVSQIFNQENILVTRKGMANSGLSLSAETTVMDEYTPSGDFVRTRQLDPSKANLSGNTLTEGFGQLSQNGKFYAIGAYEAPLGTENVATSNAATIKRIIAITDLNGTTDYTTKPNNLTGAIVGVVPNDTGDGVWIGTSSGLYYSAKGNTGAATLISTTSTNLRVPAIYNDQLFVSGNSGTIGTSAGIRVGIVGTGLPTTSGQTIVNLPGSNFSFTAGTPGISAISPWQFAIIDASPVVVGYDLLYVADDGSANAANGALTGGIKKFKFDGTSWNFVRNIAETNPTTGVNYKFRGLAASRDGDNIILYATADNKLIKTIDSDAFATARKAAASPFQVIATAPTNSFFTGISYVPSNAAPLSITLIDFSAKLDKGNSLVKWTTTQEENTKEFLLEKSKDGIAFETIAKMPARGVKVSNYYSYYDNDLKTETVFYRLKIIGKEDEKSSYSKIISLSNANGIKLSIYPNPVAESFTINHNSTNENQAYTILNQAGKTIAKGVILKGTNFTEVKEMNNLKKGVYFLKYAENKKAIKIIKK
ncbi:MAG: T9SS type A sorting domain-containing protein [Pseudarcicella sp.]|nr:T9SS type A sorting domain-containing protein [Pseudarcicella sp.]MBP6410793.1 T9SS type A sorting domain-containing protein [Pseudarcicella sp.]